MTETPKPKCFSDWLASWVDGEFDLVGLSAKQSFRVLIIWAFGVAIGAIMLRWSAGQLGYPVALLPVQAVPGVALYLAIICAIITWRDLRAHTIDNHLICALIFVSLAAPGILDGVLLSRTLGAIAVWIAFEIVSEIAFRLTGRDGLGRGDVKLIGALTFVIGWPSVPILILLASVTALAVIFVMFWHTNPAKNAGLPFAPFLTVAALCLVNA